MLRMEHRQVQTQKQTQQLMLTQKMQQALHILQLSGMELEQHIEQELETNPFLELTARAEETPDLTPDGKKDAQDEQEFDVCFDLDAYCDKWDIKHREGQDLSYNEDLHARRQYYEDSITQSESLRAHLLSQMRIAAKTDEEYAIGERIIIGDINEKGFFTGSAADIAQELNVTETAVAHVLGLIRRFEPTGVGARDITECLLLQIEAFFPQEEELKILVRDHLDALLRNQIPQIARTMKVKPERLEELKTLLKTLNPWPGHEYAGNDTQYIAPDVVVEKMNEQYIVRLASERIPDIRVNEKYLATLKQGKISKQEKEYIKEKLEAVTWLRRNVTHRQQTILKVAQAIVDFQQAFLDKGVEQIRPLTLQNVADVVGVHESTVARATRGKYMQTPQGLFELKYFFSPGLSADSGDNQSSKSIQALVKKIIDEEDKRKPLSDNRIADIIKEREGVNIARRTVTKYREMMGILNTTMRKEY